MIQRATTTADSYGGQSVSWATVYTIWPEEAVGYGGKEEERLGRASTVERFRFKVRYGPTITTLDRLTYDGRTLNIRGVQDRDGKRDYLFIDCEAGVGTQ